jgi:hypothetical protein
MDEELQLWTVRAFDDASARVALPAPDRWVPRRARESAGELRFFAFVACAAAVALGIVLLSGLSERRVPAAPRPTPSGYVLVPGGSEAETWGKVWSFSGHAAVLRPTWLPFPVESTSYSVETSSRGLTRYLVGYARGAERTYRLLLIAEGPDVRQGQRGPGERPDDLVVRGHDAQLLTSPDGSLRIIWTEGDLRYTVQAMAGINADDLVRVVESMSPVTDESGAPRELPIGPPAKP